MPSSTASFVIRDFASQADYDACIALQYATWGDGFAERVPGAILQVAQKLGGIAAGAFADDGALLGFVFGMTGVRNGEVVHWSDMLAVRADARGIGLGEQLKRYQQDALQRAGIRVMFWTADPLVARNAHFNINTLGARPVEYVENMYGENTGSPLHGRMPTDRVVYRWVSDAVAPTPLADLPSAPALIELDADGTPAHRTLPGDAVACRIAVPHDLQRVQAASSVRALAWRLAVREAFHTAFARGWRVTGFVRGDSEQSSSYVLSASPSA
jgi:predicted GNAT superfamily acetyltransferase